MSNEWKSTYQSKCMSAQQAVQHVKSGDKVVIGHACGEPPTVVEALVARAPELENVEIFHMLAMGAAPYAQLGMEKSFHYNAFFLGAPARAAVAEKRSDFTPCNFSRVPYLFRDGVLPVDVVLMQVTPPDEHGFCSFSISEAYIKAAAECAKIVIAQVNRCLPWTGGDSIHVSKIDFFVEKDEPIAELQPPAIHDVEKTIGKNVASLIEDGATLQLGIGAIPDAVLLFLKDKKDLGLHSEMFSDGVVELAQTGVITNRKKALHPGKFVATFLMGTRKLYDFVDNNPDVEIYGVDYVNDPYIVGQMDNMVSINSALQVDLMGQVNAEMIGTKQFSGVGGQVDFILGASRSKNGKAIIALPSTAAKGKISRIVCNLDHGAAATTSRNDVQYVVTEYGIANLRGKSLRERAKALIAISHPDFRSTLFNQATEQGLF